MSRHHPAPDILAEYARGALHAGAMLVVACHVENCAVCRSEVTLWEGVGGALLEATPGIALSDGALDGMLARLDDVDPQAENPPVPDYLKGVALPTPLAARKIGRRRRVTPNIWFAPVEVPSQGNARTYLVCAGPGTKLSEHTHAGREFTQVLEGAFADISGLYAQGDFACTDDTILHTPTVTSDAECLCLISTDAPMRLTGWPARLIQGLTGTLY